MPTAGDNPFELNPFIELVMQSNANKAMYQDIPLRNPNVNPGALSAGIYYIGDLCYLGDKILDWDEYITSLLINEGMDRITLTIDIHEDFVILTTRRIKSKSIVATMTIPTLIVCLQCITEHQAILNNVQLNGVPGVLLLFEFSESHQCSSVDYKGIIGHQSRVSACAVTPIQLSPHNNSISFVE